MVDYVSANAPLTDKLTADEVGSVAAFLCSPLASGITGTTMYVDQGLPRHGNGGGESGDCGADGSVGGQRDCLSTARFCSLGSGEAKDRLSVISKK